MNPPAGGGQIDYRPHQTDDTTGVSDYLNRVSKYVVSSTLQDPEWENTMFTDAIGGPELRHEETRTFPNGTVLLRNRTA